MVLTKDETKIIPILYKNKEFMKEIKCMFTPLHI